ncbi:MAG: LptE family protein [Crocinitomicaceae bacterium]|jgi:outer membrane lipopolysaccharide assembly protein LptE/RlpB|nr:LptE family protein [Crocinitomicaceae bacterium]MDG2464526.1 LptE family protein [Crocinitomicaceae bacterium]
MMKFVFILFLGVLATSCWPSRFTFVDGNMPEEWKTFTVKTLDNNSATAPNSYSSQLTEALRDGIQNNTTLLLNPGNSAEVNIEGVVNGYNVSPIALQPGDVAAKNRLTINANFTIFITKPEEDKMTISLSKFMDFDSNKDISSVESQLIEEINAQMVQDVVAKLMSGW